jgi:hypothetical protein
MNKICSTLKNLSTEAIMSILSEYKHISIRTITDRTDAEQVAQININEGLIDEIEFIIALNGE